MMMVVNGKPLAEDPEGDRNVVLRFSGEDEQDLYFSAPLDVVDALIAIANRLQETPTKSAAPGVVMRVFVAETVGEEKSPPII